MCAIKALTVSKLDLLKQYYACSFHVSIIFIATANPKSKLGSNLKTKPEAWMKTSKSKLELTSEPKQHQTPKHIQNRHQHQGQYQNQKYQEKDQFHLKLWILKIKIIIKRRNKETEVHFIGINPTWNYKIHQARNQNRNPTPTPICVFCIGWNFCFNFTVLFS